MQVVTIKAKPKTVFGAVLAITGIIVIIITFVLNHPEKTAGTVAEISCGTVEERLEYIAAQGYEADRAEDKKDIIIPKCFNKVYSDYNAVQKQQGFDLEPYKGRQAVVYTYKIKNYKNNNNVVANLIVCGGKLIGADLCDPSAKNGFLTALVSKDGKT